MNQQEFVEQNVRLVLGDLQLQIIILKARIAELEQAEQAGKANGAVKEQTREHHVSGDGSNA